MEKKLWLYRGVFSGWWCYDSENNDKINKMYSEFCRAETPIQITTKNFNDETDDLVNFCSNSESDSDIESESELSMPSVIKDKEYFIKTPHGEYKIDFNAMLQISKSDIKKRRQISHIKIPEQISTDDKLTKNFLIQHNVKGVSGNKF